MEVKLGSAASSGGESWQDAMPGKLKVKHKNTGNITVEKGSICVNGVSLTVVNSQDDSFSVAIIPFTYEHTNFHTYKVGTTVNLEFDILGKYLAKMKKQAWS